MESTIRANLEKIDCLQDLLNQFSDISKKILINTNSNNDNESSFQTIKKTLKTLPKLKSGLENFKTCVSKPKFDVVESKETNKTKKSSSSWFDMKNPVMTPEIAMEIQIIKNRNILDPKRHYKKGKWDIGKFFHVGTLIDGSNEKNLLYTKQKLGKSLFKDITSDNNSNSYLKRTYNEIQKKNSKFKYCKRKKKYKSKK